MKNEIIESLEKIYSSINNYVNWRHCHECCGPIIWSEPEEILIRKYMFQHKIKYIHWTKEDFLKNNNKCPYLQNDRCIIYPVRPIVCRLQGNISGLKCKFSSSDKLISEQQIESIRKKYIYLIKNTDSVNKFYSTKKL